MLELGHFFDHILRYNKSEGLNQTCFLGWVPLHYILDHNYVMALPRSSVRRCLAGGAFMTIKQKRLIQLLN